MLNNKTRVVKVMECTQKPEIIFQRQFNIASIYLWFVELTGENLAKFNLKNRSGY